jgi:D-methionine transport system substrate-binding protein
MKKFLSLILALALVFSIAALTGCSSSDDTTTTDTTTTEPTTDTGDTTAATTDATEDTGADTTTDASDDTTIVVGASSTPHAEVLEQVKDVLAEEGYTLEIKVFDDYILPNTALADGELDANYFQHTPYLESFNASNGTDLVSAALIHYEPFGIYGNGVTDLADLADGATIIIPADDSNETRALLLLAQEGLITLPEDASAANGVTTLDIVDDNGYNVVAVQADTVPAQLANSDDGTIAVINGNYALQAGLNIADALAIEDASGDAAQTYANIVAVRNGDENSPKIQALINALQSDAVKQFMEETYNGAVVAIF